MTEEQAAQRGTPGQRATLGLITRLQRIEDKLDQLLAKKPSRKATVIDVDFRERMLVEFGDALGGQKEVDHHIDMACAHKSHADYPGKQMHVLNWLKRAVRFEEERPRKLVQASDGSTHHVPRIYSMEERERQIVARTEEKATMLEFRQEHIHSIQPTTPLSWTETEWLAKWRAEHPLVQE